MPPANRDWWTRAVSREALLALPWCKCSCEVALALALSPPEQPLDVGEVERDVGRAAVIALAAVGGRLHLAQQRVHLGRREVAPGAHAGMAGEGAADGLDPLLQGQRIAPFGELVSEVAHQRADIEP